MESLLELLERSNLVTSKLAGLKPAGLHYRRDVTYQEDQTRMTDKRTGRTMAIINNLVISLLNRQGFANHAQVRREFNAAPNKALALICGLYEKCAYYLLLIDLSFSIC